MLEQQSYDENEPVFEAIRRSLRSRNASVVQAAEQDLGGLRVPNLILLIEIEKEQRKLRRRNFIIGLSLYVIIALMLSIFAHSWHFFNMFGMMGGIGGGLMAFSKAHKSAALALAKFDDVAGIGPLIEALEMQDKDVQQAVRESLTRMLPKLHSSDAGLLNPSARRILRSTIAVQSPRGRIASNRPIGSVTKDALLGPRFVGLPDGQFVVSALKGLEQVGDETFVETVENLAQGQGYGYDADVRIAAERCLPYLKQRAENERLKHDLLRASSADCSHDSESLLRAAQSNGHTEPAELLRASGSISD